MGTSYFLICNPFYVRAFIVDNKLGILLRIIKAKDRINKIDAAL